MPIPLLAIGGLAAAGGLSSMLGANESAQNLSNALSTIRGVSDSSKDQLNNIVSSLSSSYSPYLSGASDSLVNYQSLLGQDLSSLEYDQADPFSYDLNSGIQSFLDPSTDYQVKEATNAVEGSAANAGGLFSSSTAKGIQNRAQNIAQQSYKDALAAALEDRAFQYQTYQGDIQNDQAAKDQLTNLYNSKLTGYGNLANMGLTASTGYADALAAAQQNAYTTQNNAALTAAGLQANASPTGLPAFLGGAGSVLGSLASFL